MTQKNLVENSRSIAEWGEETFGKATLEALARRAHEELDELIEAVGLGESPKAVAMEAADVTILLHRLAGTVGKDLSDCVNEKMVLNRKRSWVKSGDGTGQHK